MADNLSKNENDPAEVLAVEERDPMHNEEKCFSKLRLTGESGLNADLANRLLHMVPGLDDSQSENLRLLQRLKKFDLKEKMVQRDGNCQFRSLSDQLYRSPHHHEHVRQKIMNKLKSEEEFYKDFVFDIEYEAYLQKMSESGEWGDHITLKAASDLFGVKFLVLTSHKDICYYEIKPEIAKSTQVMCLSFREHEEHYNSIRVRKEDVEEASALPEVHLPIVPASWKSCCGMFEALFGSDTR